MLVPPVSKTAKVKQITLGADKTISASSTYELAFTDNTINILGVLGYTLGDRSFGPYLSVTGMFPTDAHTVKIYGKSSKNEAITISAAAFVYVLYE